LNIQTPRPTPIGGVSKSPFVESTVTTQKRPSIASKEIQAPITVISDVEIHNVVIAPSIQIGSKTNNSNNVT
jgi:hypothetical protein